MYFRVFIVIVFIAYIKYILLLVTSPFLYVYCFLHKRKSEANPIGEINETFYNSKKDFVRRKVIDYVDGYYRWMIKVVSEIPSHYIRNLFYKNVFLVKMHKKAVIYHGCEIRGSWLLSLDEGAIVGDNAILDARRGGIYIGKNVNIGSNVSIWTDGHDMNDPYFRTKPCNRGAVILEDYTWIGPNVTILHSVNIKKGCVVAAGSVVTKDTSPYMLFAGIPAKPIAARNKDLKYDLGKSHLHFL